MEKQEEILTFEIYQRDGEMIIHLPVANINPISFELIEQSLIIHLENKDLLLTNLNDRVIRHIQQEKCFIIENLDHIKGKTFHVVL